MNSVLWKALKKNGTSVTQMQNGKYTNFVSEDKSDWILFSLHNLKNNSNYSIDLIRGTFLFNGIPVVPSIQNDLFDIPILKKGFKYSSTLFWYNEMITQIGVSTDSYCANVHIGYVVDINEPCIINNREGILVKARPMLKLCTANNTVSFSTSYQFKQK